MFTRAALALAVALVGCDAELATGLTSQDADAIVLALDEARIPARKSPARGARGERFRVEVERGELVRAMAVLRDSELPRERPAGLEELLGEPGLVPDVEVERARVAAATAAELSRTLEGLEGIERARVHIALPAPRALDDEPGHPRASVALRAGDAAPDDQAVAALIAGAVDGLATESVAVVRSPPPPARPRRATRYTHVGPLAVSPSTAPLLKGVLAGSLTLHLVLAGALLYRRRRGVADQGSTTGGAADPRGGERTARAEQMRG